MTERTAEVSAHPRARITGIVYLFYFLTAVSAQFLHGHKPAIFSDAFNGTNK